MTDATAPSRNRPNAPPGSHEEPLAPLLRSGARWCLLREPGQGSGPIDEIDLLVDERDRVLAERSLAASGFAPRPAWGRGSHRFLYAYLVEAGSWVKLDLVTELAYGSHQQFRTDAAGACLDRVRLDAGLPRLAADDEFWTLALHCLLDKGRTRDDHAARLRELAGLAGTSGPLPRALESRWPSGWDAEGVLSVARAGDLGRFEGLAHDLARAWTRRSPVAVRRLLVRNRLLRRLAKLQTLLQRRSLRVVLLGPDGAGKSTLAADLVRSYPFPARRLYAGLYPAGGPRRRLPPGLRLLCLFLRLRRDSLVARYHQARGRLVVFDRYTFDALLQSGGSQRARSRLRRWLLAHSCPQPDLTVLLDAPSEVFHARKREHSLETIEEQRRRYRALEGRVANLVVVDAAQKRDRVRREVTELIWERSVRAGTG